MDGGKGRCHRISETNSGKERMLIFSDLQWDPRADREPSVDWICESPSNFPSLLAVSDSEWQTLGK